MPSWSFPCLGMGHGWGTHPTQLRKWSTFSREGCPQGGVGRDYAIIRLPQPKCPMHGFESIDTLFLRDNATNFNLGSRNHLDVNSRSS